MHADDDDGVDASGFVERVSDQTSDCLFAPEARSGRRRVNERGIYCRRARQKFISAEKSRARFFK